MNRLFWFLCFFLPSLALADTLPYWQIDLRQKMQNDPNTYDRADQFCAQKKVGSPCTIPGNPFEGGGTGTCQTRLNDRQPTIDSLCTFTGLREVMRKIPDRGYKGSEHTCDSARQNPSSRAADDIKNQNLTCGPTPTVPDQFCDGKAAGDTCMAEMQVDSAKFTYPGRCAESEDRAKFYSLGYNVKVRTVLLCLPENPVRIEIGPSSPPNWLQRMLE
jgi:hypothetical protein